MILLVSRVFMGSYKFYDKKFLIIMKKIKICIVFHTSELEPYTGNEKRILTLFSRIFYIGLDCT